MNRRKFLNLTVAGAAATLIRTPLSAEREREDRTRIRAIAFDGFVIFDPRAVVKRAEEVLPGKGTEFVGLWRTRQFEYTWLRTSGSRYEDFWRVTEDALRYTARSLKLSLTAAQQKALMSIYRELPVWPDVPQALADLRNHGIRLRFLSNFSAAMLEANLANAKLRGYFEDNLSTDRVRAYKPSPHAYQMGVDSFGMKRGEIAFAAFGAWDAAGAKWFGYPTVWVNRGGAPEEELGTHPDLITPDLAGLLRFVSVGQ